MGAAGEPRRKTLLSEVIEAREPNHLDEPKVRVNGELVRLWVALDPQRRAVLPGSTPLPRPEMFASQASSRKLMEEYGREVVSVTDGGKWPLLGCGELGGRKVWLRVESKAGVERWFRTIKDRPQLRLPLELKEPRTSQHL